MEKIVGITPKEYQAKILEASRHLASFGLTVKTGGGKTFISLLAFNRNPTSNLLVLCPSKVVTQWQSVIQAHTKVLKVCEYKKSWSAKKRFEEVEKQVRANRRYNAVVLSLESVASLDDLEYLINDDWTIIVDESHKIKDMGTKRKPVQVTKAVLNLRDCTPFKMLLTATPTQKDKGGYIDFYPQVYFLGYVDYSIDTFKARYCIEKKIQPIGLPFPIKVVTGYNKNISEFDNIIKNVFFGYTPKYTDGEPVHTKIELDTPSSYAKLSKEKMYGDLDLRNLSARRMAKKTLCTGTVIGHDVFKNPLQYHDNDVKLDWLKEFMSNTDEVLMIVYKYNVERDSLVKLCESMNKKYIVIDGNAKNKYELINKNDYDVVIGQFEGCGESIDGLQYKTHICIYYCLPESSISYRQTLGRINRVGQEYLPMYYYLVIKKSIEDDIWKLMQSKIEYSESMLDELEVKGGLNGKED